MLAGAEYHNDQRVALTVVAGVSLLVTFGSLRGSLAPLFSAETFLPTLVRLVSATLIHLSVPCLTLLHSRRLGLIVAVCIVVLSVGVGEGLFGVNSTSQLPLPLPLINSVRRANELLQTEGFKVSVPLGPFYEYGIYSLMAWGVAAELGLIYERHLRSQHRALNDATERIRQKSSVLSRVSHELRTPTTAIVSWTELLLIDKTMSEDVRSQLGIVHDAAKHLVVLLNEILDAGKLEATFERTPICNVDLDFCVRDTANMMSQMAVVKGLELIIDYPRSVPTNFRGEDGRLRQVLINLLSNAIKFTSRGTVTIKVEVDELTNENAVVVLTVFDTGIGIPTELMDILFKEYSQLPIHPPSSAGSDGSSSSYTSNISNISNISRDSVSMITHSTATGLGLPSLIQSSAPVSPVTSVSATNSAAEDDEYNNNNNNSNSTIVPGISKSSITFNNRLLRSKARGRSSGNSSSNNSSNSSSNSSGFGSSSGSGSGSGSGSAFSTTSTSTASGSRKSESQTSTLRSRGRSGGGGGGASGDAACVRQAKAGTGLGLSIVKNFVEAMGGTIKADSEYGKGTRFTARIPLGRQVILAAPSAAASVAPSVTSTNTVFSNPQSTVSSTFSPGSTESDMSYMSTLASMVSNQAMQSDSVYPRPEMGPTLESLKLDSSHLYIVAETSFRDLLAKIFSALPRVTLLSGFDLPEIGQPIQSSDDQSESAPRAQLSGDSECNNNDSASVLHSSPTQDALAKFEEEEVQRSDSGVGPSSSHSRDSSKSSVQQQQQQQQHRRQASMAGRSIFLVDLCPQPHTDDSQEILAENVLHWLLPLSTSSSTPQPAGQRDIIIFFYSFDQLYDKQFTDQFSSHYDIIRSSKPVSERSILNALFHASSAPSAQVPVPPQMPPASILPSPPPLADSLRAPEVFSDTVVGLTEDLAGLLSTRPSGSTNTGFSDSIALPISSGFPATLPPATATASATPGLSVSPELNTRRPPRRNTDILGLRSPHFTPLDMTADTAIGGKTIPPNRRTRSSPVVVPSIQLDGISNGLSGSADASTRLAPCIESPLTATIPQQLQQQQQQQQQQQKQQQQQQQLQRPTSAASTTASLASSELTPLPSLPMLTTSIYSKLRVLVVDDNSMTRSLTVRQLKHQHILNIDEATDGSFACFKYSSAQYDLVLMDLHMPRMDGFLAARRMREIDSQRAKSMQISMASSIATASNTPITATFDSAEFNALKAAVSATSSMRRRRSSSAQSVDGLNSAGCDAPNCIGTCLKVFEDMDASSDCSWTSQPDVATGSQAVTATATATATATTAVTSSTGTATAFHRPVIVALTADRDVNQDAAADSGFDGTLVKPVPLNDFSKLLNKYFGPPDLTMPSST